MRLVLLRHGETTQGGGFRGTLNDALTDIGWQHMLEAVPTQIQVNQVVSSPLLRCLSFAEHFAKLNRLPLSIEPAFQEIHFGDWEGHTAEYLMEHHPEQLTKFWADPFAYTPPHAESTQHFMERVFDGVAKLQEVYPDKTVLLVTHAGVIRLLLARAQGVALKELLQINVNHASVHQLDFKANARGDIV